MYTYSPSRTSQLITFGINVVVGVVVALVVFIILVAVVTAPPPPPLVVVVVVDVDVIDDVTIEECVLVCLSPVSDVALPV